MLIIKRKPGDAVQIGDLITIHFFDHNRIGIDAPREVPVVRTEVLARAVAACVKSTSKLDRITENAAANAKD